MPPRPKILLINPNSSQSMTDNLKPIIDQHSSDIIVYGFTAPSDAPKSINNEEDARLSADVVIKELSQTIRERKFDGYLVACYSYHPLVQEIKTVASDAGMRDHRDVYIVGIFEASIITAIALISTGDMNQKFGIVTTGAAWEKALSDGLLHMLKKDSLDQFPAFKGVESTGLNADELHTAPKEIMTQKMKEATKRLIRDKDIRVIILGCAGMSGLDQIVKDALVEELGEEEARVIHVLDPVHAGLTMMQTVLGSLSEQPSMEGQAASASAVQEKAPSKKRARID